MVTSRKMKKYICILLAIFYVFVGMCFDTVETGSFLKCTNDGTEEGIQVLVSMKKGVSFISSETLDFSNGEASVGNREKTVRGGLVPSFLVLAFGDLFLRIAYECRRLLGLSDVIETSEIKNILCYIHKQDGKKGGPVLF